MTLMDVQTCEHRASSSSHASLDGRCRDGALATAFPAIHYGIIHRARNALIYGRWNFCLVLSAR